mgnify:CR=1 FL=1
MKLYLAGPDVFRPDARQWAAQSQALCAAAGHQAAIAAATAVDCRRDQPAGDRVVDGVDPVAAVAAVTGEPGVAAVAAVGTVAAVAPEEAGVAALAATGSPPDVYRTTARPR